MGYTDDLLKRPGERFRRNFGMAGYTKRAVIAFLREFFADPENTKGYGDDEGQFVYFEDDTPEANPGAAPKNRLDIVDRLSYDQNTADGRPKIVIIRGQMNRDPKTIDNGTLHKDIGFGKSVRQSIKHVSIQIIVKSGNGDEAERLADIVFEAISAFAPSLREVLGWDSIDSVDMSPENPDEIDSVVESTTVVITVAGQLTSNYEVTKSAKKMGGVEICKQPTMIGNAGKTVKFK